MYFDTELDENKAIGVKRAAQRKLKHELGIQAAEVGFFVQKKKIGKISKICLLRHFLLKMMREGGILFFILLKKYTCVTKNDSSSHFWKFLILIMHN